MEVLVEGLQVKLAALRLKKAEINLDMREVKLSIESEEDPREKSIRKLNLLTLYEDRENISTDIEEVLVDLSKFNVASEDVGAGANSRREDNGFPHMISISPEERREDPLFAEENNPRPSTLPELPVTNDHPPIASPRESPSFAHNSSSTSRYSYLARPQLFKAGDDISLFFDRFDQFVKLSNIRDGNLDLYMLSLIKDDNMYRKLKAVSLTFNQKSDVGLLIKAFEESLFPATETRILRSTLSTTKQKSGESATDFAIRIEVLASKAYSNMELREEACLSAFLTGFENVQVRQKLLEADVDSFECATRMAVKLERITEALANGKSSCEDSDFTVLKINNNSHPAPPNPTVQQQPQAELPNQYNDRFRGNQRPANDRSVSDIPSTPITCYSCNQPGHKSNNCPNRRNQVSYRRDNSSNQSHITCYYCNNKGHYASSCPQRRYPTSNTRSNREQWRPHNQQNDGATSNSYSSSHLNGNTAGRYPVHPSRRQ